ncbi:MAG: hypothetical protein AB1428_01635 [Bacteroidota bacterium]
MKLRILSGLILSLLLGSVVTHAQLVNGRLVTSFYTLERFDTVGRSTTYLRAFQAVQLSAAEGDFSLHTYLLGMVNGTGAFGENGRVRVSNLYLRWANIGRAADVNLGRQAVYAGVGNGTIDGIMARVRLLDDMITVTGYGGSTVVPDFTGLRSNWHDNLHFGGRVLTTVLPGARIGLSYMNRREEVDPYWALRARDTTFTPVPYYVAPDPYEDERGSADVSYACGEDARVYARYDYDFLTNTTARGQGALRVNVAPDLALTGEYIYRKPRVAFNSIFSAFTQNSVSEVEGGVEYSITALCRVYGKLGQVSYTDETSMRWTLGLFAQYGSVSYSGSSGYAGELQSFNVQGAYPLLDRMIVPSLGVSFASYKLSADAPRDDALAVLAGATVRPVRTFSVELQGQWMRNRLYDRDMRLQVRLMYWFAERMSLFTEEVK